MSWKKGLKCKTVPDPNLLEYLECRGNIKTTRGQPQSVEEISERYKKNRFKQELVSPEITNRHKDAMMREFLSYQLSPVMQK